jgi:hypothetical protein
MAINGWIKAKRNKPIPKITATALLMGNIPMSKPNVIAKSKNTIDFHSLGARRVCSDATTGVEKFVTIFGF